MEPKVLEEVKRRVLCSLCQRETTNRTYLICRKCDGLVVCLACVRRRHEGGPHLSSHPYSVVQRLDFPLRSPDWTASQEILLLEAVDKFGYANWTDITAYIGSKTGPEVEEHFARFYPLKPAKTAPPLDRSPKAPEPRPVRPLCPLTRSLDEHTERPLPPETLRSHRSELSPIDERARSPPRNDLCLRNLHFENRSPNCCKPRPFAILFERRIEPLLPLLRSKPAPAEVDGFEALAAKTKNLLGYMEHRDEFDVEYNNEAELYLADMEFRGDETPEELRTKMDVLAIYQARKAQRESRRRFVIQHQLFDFDAMLAAEKGSSNEERVFRNMLRPLLQFLTRDQAEDLLECFGHKVKFERLRHHVGHSRRHEEPGPGPELGDKNMGKLIEQARLASNCGNARRLGEPSRPRTETGRALDAVFEEEVELCQREGLDVDEFLLAKELLVKREVLEPAGGRRAAPRSGLDRRAFLACQDFLVKKGLVHGVHLGPDQ